jgi:DNA-binding HxlR family transcriptional regulator
MVMKKTEHVACKELLVPLRDALDVISGKWKLQIIISISSGNRRFREIERSIPKITSKVLAKELKDLETHLLIKRTEFPDAAIKVEYSLLPYARSLQGVIEALMAWGAGHRKKMFGKG